MNKEYKISELMENYSDNEFFLEGEQTVDTEKAVSELLAQAKPKKRMKPMFKALAAAAAAAAVFAGATIASSSIIGKGHFTTALNARVEYDSWDKHEGGDIYSHSNVFSYETTDLIYPAEERDGRLIFTVDGQNTDITDLIDRRTPYIYSYTIPQTGFPAHIIVGGDPDDPAYIEIICFEGFGWHGYGGFLNDEKDLAASISVTIGQYGEDGELQFSGHGMNRRGWYLSDTSELIYYHRREDTNGDGEIQENEVFKHDHNSAGDIPLTWEKDCPDAWLISAFLQLELFELPDFSLIDPVAQTADGRVILVAGGQNTDITDLLSESKPYVYAAEKSDNNKDSYILIGGTPEDLGWALVCRSNDNVWVAAERNVIGGGLREWFVNGAEQIGYDLESLLYTLGVVR